MRRFLTRGWSLLPVLALIAVPVSAEVYHVTLSNGTVLDTAYQPQEASWDSSLVLFLDDTGNWIGMPKTAIESVQSEAEKSGFGKVIDTNTIELGYAANDAEDPDAQAANGQQGATARTDPAAAAAANALQGLYQQRQAEQGYTIKQFVNPNETQGIPARFSNPNASAVPVAPPQTPQH
jgi:hypothetical protein